MSTPVIAIGAEFAVNSEEDRVDINPGNGICDTGRTTGFGSAECTLRAAVQEANALSGADSIRLPTGIFRLSIPRSTNLEHDASMGDLDITDNLTISGSGSSVIQNEANARIIEIPGSFVFEGTPTTGAVVSISGVVLKDGVAESSAGILWNAGTLTLSSVVVENGEAASEGTGGSGAGGIYNTGTLTMTRSIVSGNRAAIGAGLINVGLATLRDVTIRQNISTGGAGGILNSASGVLIIEKTTISGNTSTEGGGLFNDGEASLTNVTISSNSSRPGSNSGGIFVAAGSVQLLNVTITSNAGGIEVLTTGNISMKNTIVGDQSSRADCLNRGGSLTSRGHNLSSSTSCSLRGSGDLENVDPLLEGLADNGGFTRTHALQTRRGVLSPAIDAGDNSGCPSTDQRNESRPTDGDGDGTRTCDIGAYEAIGTAPTPRVDDPCLNDLTLRVFLCRFPNLDWVLEREIPPLPLNPGQEFTVEWRVTPPSDILGIEVHENLPAGFEMISGSPDLTFNHLTVGQKVTLSYRVRASQGSGNHTMKTEVVLIRAAQQRETIEFDSILELGSSRSLAPPKSIGDYDANKNDIIEDSEFFVAVDDWLSESIEDITFFQVLDLWISSPSNNQTPPQEPTPPPPPTASEIDLIFDPAQLNVSLQSTASTKSVASNLSQGQEISSFSLLVSVGQNVQINVKISPPFIGSVSDVPGGKLVTATTQIPMAANSFGVITLFTIDVMGVSPGTDFMRFLNVRISSGNQDYEVNLSDASVNVTTTLTSSGVSIRQEHISNKHSLVLTIGDLAIRSLKFELFDSSGHRMIDQTAYRPSTLRISLTSNTGLPLANGIYLYRVSTTSWGETRFLGAIEKLVVIR
jgi:hypothetical protein